MPENNTSQAAQAAQNFGNTNQLGNSYLQSDEAVKFRDEMLDRFTDMAHTGSVSKQPLDDFLRAVQMDAWIRGRGSK